MPKNARTPSVRSSRPCIFLRNSDLRGRGLDEFETEQVGAAAQVIESALVVALLVVADTWIFVGPAIPEHTIEEYGNLVRRCLNCLGFADPCCKPTEIAPMAVLVFPTPMAGIRKRDVARLDEHLVFELSILPPEILFPGVSQDVKSLTVGDRVISLPHSATIRSAE